MVTSTGARRTVDRMNPLVRNLLDGQGGVLASRDAAAIGVGSAELRSLVRRGELVSPRRGAFVEAERYAAATPDERYGLRVRAVLRTRPEDAASHHAALALWGVDLYGVDLARIDVATPNAAKSSCSGVRVHPMPGVSRVLIGGQAAVALPIALAQTVITSGVEAGVCAIDDALRDGECTPGALRGAFAGFAPKWQRRLGVALDLADALCESVGESRTRLLLATLRIPHASQVVVLDGDRFVGRVDFLLWGRVVLEFDGRVKYEGLDGARALIAEKGRESHLSALGLEVVRIVWSDLADPGRLARILRQALRRALGRSMAADLRLVRGGKPLRWR